MRAPPVRRLMVVPLVGLALAGCGGGGTRGDAVPSRPEVTAGAVTPKELRFTGGAVRITAAVLSEGRIQQVSAAVEGRTGLKTVSLKLDGGQYVASFAAQPNAGSFPEDYAVTITATDKAGRTSAGFLAGGFAVRPAPSPPNAPEGW